MTDQTVSHFAFEMTDEDDRIFRKMAWRCLKAHIDKRISKGIPLAVYFCLSGALFYIYADDAQLLTVLFVRISGATLPLQAKRQFAPIGSSSPAGKLRPAGTISYAKQTSESNCGSGAVVRHQPRV